MQNKVTGRVPNEVVADNVATLRCVHDKTDEWCSNWQGFVAVLSAAMRKYRRKSDES
jgi:hypothetical protein